MTHDIVIRGGNIIDGTGSEAFVVMLPLMMV